MKVLITGVCGMVGSHMADYFRNKRIHVIGTYYKPTINLSEIETTEKYECDVRYYKPLYEIINRFKPEKIFHLAAQSYPTVSLGKPEETFDINVTGTINIFEAIQEIRSINENYDPVVIVACSSAEYGTSLTPENVPINESEQLLPLHPYGVSKVTQDLLTYQYYVNYNLRGIRARIFNTTGPRKVNDVCSDFIRKGVEIELGKRDTLTVGNLETRRAITDVRDLVTALDALADSGDAGEVYNICGDKDYKISDLLEMIKSYMKADFKIETDPKLMRTTDEPIIFGDSSKLKAATGWEQKIPIEQTIADMVEYWRKVL